MRPHVCKSAAMRPTNGEPTQHVEPTSRSPDLHVGDGQRARGDRRGPKWSHCGRGMRQLSTSSRSLWRPTWSTRFQGMLMVLVKARVWGIEDNTET